MSTLNLKSVTTVGDSAGDSTLGLEALSFGFRVLLIFWVFRFVYLTIYLLIYLSIVILSYYYICGGIYILQKIFSKTLRKKVRLLAKGIHHPYEFM